jgi:ACS family sodium-dependent inorganic phosphate cotransporter-like MFS transporter 5
MKPFKAEKRPPLLFSVRFMLSFFGFLLTAIQYMQRINMSVAIVCMINNTRLEEISHLTEFSNSTFVKNYDKEISQVKNESFFLVNEEVKKRDEKCSFTKNNNKTNTRLDGPFAWDKQIQGLVLSSFFYGYLLTQIIGGWLAIRFGSKIVLEISILLGSVFTLLTPVAARLHWTCLIACRFLIGIAHGVVWPAMMALWPYWAPPAERSTILGFSSAGSQIGNVITLPLGGYLCENGFDGGWASIFYVIGIIGLGWCISWWLLVANSPDEHNFISSKEKAYIIKETKEALCSSSSSSKSKTPWIKILTSKAFYGLCITHTCSNFCTYLFLTQLPSYMSEVLFFDIKSNGLLSAIPYLLFWLFTILSGILSDKMIQSGKITRTACRKLFNTIGFTVPMFAVIGLIFVNCQYPYLGVLCIAIGLAFTGLTYGSGFLVNYNDVGGRFSGMVFGISNTIGTLSGIVAPYLVGILTKNKKQEEWSLVFIVTSCVYLVGAITFIILGTGETQKWALKEPKKMIVEEELQPLSHKL